MTAGGDDVELRLRLAHHPPPRRHGALQRPGFHRAIHQRVDLRVVPRENDAANLLAFVPRGGLQEIENRQGELAFLQVAPERFARLRLIAREVYGALKADLRALDAL